MEKGQKFGLLTLIKEVPRPEGKNRKGKYWLCQCDCGNQCIKYHYDISRGDTKSCGCLQHRKPIYDKNEHEISNHAGIYGFQNVFNGHWYIGKAKNLYNRYCRHKNDWQTHQEKQFYQAIKKYGWDSFNYYILKEYLEMPTREELSEQEEYFIQKYDSYKNGYNASYISSGGFYSEEHQEKCTQILKNLNQKQKNENHPNTDFTKNEILDIFHFAMLGAPVKEIYEKYKHHDISYEGFKQIYRGQHFRDYLPNSWESRPVVATNSKLWGIDVIDIKTRLLKGEDIQSIYQDYKEKCSLAVIQNIKNNKTYKQIHPCID